MLNSIIWFSIKHKLAIAMLTFLLIVWGVWSATKLPIDAVPDITNNQVQIITNTPSLATQEVEQFVTYPIEQAIANIPDVEEIRSISRFGLSVVTVVFKDDVNIYFARQQLNERLKEAEEQIPSNMGTPELAPVSTGLGEIYQYMIHPKKGSESKYSLMDLRTMQDWIVARQLYGTPGVAEVNSFGGMLKQYEVAIDPTRLKALNVSIAEIFGALEKNNENTGGAYIDRKPNAFFIRGIGLISSLEDVGNIIIRNTNGVPVLVKDVALVRFGNATRYGAMSYNGEYEVVGGIVMMLKGSNSAKVVAEVKEKMETIKKSLPADVEIEPFLDRTSLVNRAMSTVETNLIEGALIVVFVLVVFLGNFRAGLIVASAIPLAMLFALGMMNVFGVSANLMSLGAIDFGLIVDGAVIIVEATMHHLGLRKNKNRLTQGEMNTEVFESASKIRNSAAFGEIIILIVYIPILTLVGIEGKMFRPMAQTVGFAILGALLLSLTYIPMMCALFLPKSLPTKKNISDKIMDRLHKWYAPILHWSVKMKYAVVTVSTVLLILSIVIFSRMGGEFIPQLQEGDYAFHCILPQGSSLSQSIETSMLASRIIKGFPEVKDVVAKTGSAEVPTDPMPPEASDLIIVLKEKSEWTTTDNYDELARMMEEKLEAIPGVFFEANQPIQMRFNELMTGVRQDVAIKIFGENIDTLSAIAPRIAKVIQSVEGATEPQIERTAGLPQITITYDRARIASYGMNIKDINNVVSAAFAGEKAGVVFENERKFDLVVRLDSAYRSSIEDVENLYILSGSGLQIPLSQVANVEFKSGPAQISREAAKRRIVVGFNVEGRDVQSVVQDIQEKLNNEFKLPTGYYLTYGGTFENLEKASARLKIAVPIALLLIFALLYFTFRSFKQATLIFTAIPMAAIGGVFALLLRGMPFSISAGVGFIALFGVAVLNGIVLIGTFNQLAKDGMNDVIERIKEGTRIRLRPVLMTATVASLGFLPMALSSGAGAEVQKPLATVVIGGLITATILTLIVLPILYIIFTKNKNKLKSTTGKMAGAVILMLITFTSTAQQKSNLPTATFYDTTLKNNLLIQAADLQISLARLRSSGSANLPRTGIFAENEDITPQDNGILKIGLSQSFEWPGLYKARKDVLKEQILYAESSRKVQETEIRKNIASAYYEIWYLQNKRLLWQKLDSTYRNFAQTTSLRVRTGESAALDSIAASVKAKEIAVQLEVFNQDILSQKAIMKNLLNEDLNLPDSNEILRKISVVIEDSISSHPLLALQRNNIAISAAQIKLEQQSNKPTFESRFFSQRLYGVSNPHSGFSVTVGIPLFGRSYYKNAIEAAEMERDFQLLQYNYQEQFLNTQYRQQLQQLQKHDILLRFYESEGLQQANSIIMAANLAYRGGVVNFTELIQYIQQAIDIHKNYLEVLNQYNQTAIQLKYFLNR